MSGAVATFTNPRLLERPANERTEYEDAYQWRGLPEKPQDTHEDIDNIHPSVNPAMYNTTTKDAYKPYDPDAYRREQPTDDGEGYEKVPVDPAMYNTTTKDAYKPHDPDAYRREQPTDDGNGYEKVPVDPAMYNTTTKDAYKPYDPDAYRREQPTDDGEGYEKVPVDPAMYNTTTKDAYKPYDPDAYRRVVDEVPSELPVLALSDRAFSTPAETHVGGLAEGTAEATPSHVDVEQKPNPRMRRAQADPAFYESIYAKDYKPAVPTAEAVPAPADVSEPAAEKPDPRMRRAQADLSSYQSTYAKDYGCSDGAPASVVGKPVVPPLRIPSEGKSNKKNGTARTSVRAPIAGRQKERSSVPAAKAHAPVSPPASAEEAPTKKTLPVAPAKTGEPAEPRPRPKGSYETEYRKNYRAYSNKHTPVETPRRTQACVHHVDPAFYTTTCSAAYVAPAAAPARSAFTRPTVSVRHVDPSMYVSTSRAAYA